MLKQTLSLPNEHILIIVLKTRISQLIVSYFILFIVFAYSSRDELRGDGN